MQIILSKTMNMDGRTVMTTTIDISAPLARSIQSSEISPISEYTATPTVAAKNPSAEVITDLMDVLSDIPMDSFLSLPRFLSVRYDE